jgi:hypothetical protein
MGIVSAVVAALAWLIFGAALIRSKRRSFRGIAVPVVAGIVGAAVVVMAYLMVSRDRRDLGSTEIGEVSVALAGILAALGAIPRSK